VAKSFVTIVARPEEFYPVGAVFANDCPLKGSAPLTQFAELWPDGQLRNVDGYVVNPYFFTYYCPDLVVAASISTIVASAGEFWRPEGWYSVSLPISIYKVEIETAVATRSGDPQKTLTISQADPVRVVTHTDLPTLPRLRFEQLRPDHVVLQYGISDLPHKVIVSRYPNFYAVDPVYLDFSKKLKLPAWDLTKNVPFPLDGYPLSTVLTAERVTVPRKFYGIGEDWYNQYLYAREQKG
jgi:hypothetical protein